MCRKVQVERPRASTSGGQSGGCEVEGEGEVEVVGWVVVGGVRLLAAVSFLVMASQEETEVQERQLGVVSCNAYVGMEMAKVKLTVCHLYPALRPWVEPSFLELLGPRDPLWASCSSSEHR